MNPVIFIQTKGTTPPSKTKGTSSLSVIPAPLLRLSLRRLEDGRRKQAFFRIYFQYFQSFE